MPLVMQFCRVSYLCCTGLGFRFVPATYQPAWCLPLECAIDLHKQGPIAYVSGSGQAFAPESTLKTRREETDVPNAQLLTAERLRQKSDVCSPLRTTITQDPSKPQAAPLGCPVAQRYYAHALHLPCTLSPLTLPRHKSMNARPRAATPQAGHLTAEQGDPTCYL